MNLVRQDHHVVLHAQFADARKLLGRIDASRRIVRVRHQENLRPGELAVEVVEVDPETAVGTLQQRVVDDHPVVESRLPRERMVDRRLDHHPVALLRESTQRENDSGDHARSEVDPLLFHFPTAVTPHPVDHRPEITVRTKGISVNRMPGPADDRFGNGLGHCKIHIGDPHRNHVRAPEHLVPRVELFAVGRLAGNDFIEIVIHTQLNRSQSYHIYKKIAIPLNRLIAG